MCFTCPVCHAHRPVYEYPNPRPAVQHSASQSKADHPAEKRHQDQRSSTAAKTLTSTRDRAPPSKAPPTKFKAPPAKGAPPRKAPPAAVFNNTILGPMACTGMGAQLWRSQHGEGHPLALRELQG